MTSCSGRWGRIDRGRSVREGKVLLEPIPGGFTVPSEYEIEYTYDNGLKHTCKTHDGQLVERADG